MFWLLTRVVLPLNLSVIDSVSGDALWLRECFGLEDAFVRAGSIKVRKQKRAIQGEGNHHKIAIALVGLMEDLGFTVDIVAITSP
ncbi:hypothetical protein O9993_00490 [Vibrio lentus]|nr:hypothetical protein [Vibrio lentus]